MYTHSQQINNLKSFVVSSQYEFGIEDNTVINLENLSEVFKSAESLQSINQNSGVCFVNDLYGKGYYLAEDGFKEIKDYSIINVLNKDRLLVKDKENTCFYDVNTGRISSFLNARIFTHFIEGGKILFKDGSQLMCVELSDVQNQWSFELSDLGLYKDGKKEKKYTLKSIVGVWDGLFLVWLSNYRLLGLDMKSGELRYDLDLHHKYALESQNYLSAKSPVHLDKENGRLVWLTNSSLIYVDLNTFESTLTKDFFNVPVENRWRFEKSTLCQGKLCFTADLGMEYAVSTYVGIMDMQSAEVEWYEQLEKTGGLSTPPFLNENKLYVLGSKGGLHIFERV